MATVSSPAQVDNASFSDYAKTINADAGDAAAAAAAVASAAAAAKARDALAAGRLRVPGGAVQVECG